jgi:hypothetical protein
MSYTDEDYRGLMKIADDRTVGDFMNFANQDFSLSPFTRRAMFDQINRNHMDVKEKASRLPYIFGGGIAGNYVSKWLGINQTLGMIGGALVGNSLFNRQHPQPGVLKGGFRRI